MAGPLDLETLRQSFVLRGLPQAELEQVAALMRRRTYRRGEAVCRQGDPGEALHVVLEGRLKVVIAAETGDEVIPTVLGAGDLFGELALLDGGPRSATVVALEPVATAILNRADFLQLLRRSPVAVEGLLAALAGTIRRDSDELADLVALDVPGRLAKNLLRLSETHGRPVRGAIEIDLPITQEELAAMIGATRETVSKLLGRYEDRGVIERQGRRVVVLRPDVLRARANS
jgi:CRP/FNR family transcriptional regulator/CRP/FNR family cyclic AMP-dependent transcriptional regulator